MTSSWQKQVLSRMAMPSAAIATAIVIVYFGTIFPIILRLVLIGVLSLIGYASWVGYRENRALNDEWPFNLAVLTLSAMGIVALIATAFS